MWTTFLCLSFTHQRMLDWDAALLPLHLTTYYQLVGFSVLASWTTLRSSAEYDPSVSQSVFTITEKDPTGAFSWVKLRNRHQIGMPTQRS